MSDLAVSNFTKSFHGVKAADGISATFYGGEIHCVVGENGAGKSTLIKYISGLYGADSGSISIDGEEVFFQTPRDSQRSGIAVVHQELLLISDLSIAENICLGNLPVKALKLINRPRMRQIAADALSKLGVTLDVDQKIADTSTGEQQLVEIARSISKEVKILILDEPTAALSESEAQKLLGVIKNLREKGIAILYVSHRMEEIFDIADKITILRDGKLISTSKRGEVSQEDVIRMMVGTELSRRENKKSSQKKFGDVILKIEGLTRGRALNNVSFELHRGEILGLGGLVGAGRTEIVRAIFGIDKYERGEIRLRGEKVVINSPCRAIKFGINLVPEDRKTQGLVLLRSIRENIVLPVLTRISTGGFLSSSTVNNVANKFSKMMMVKATSIKQDVQSLSGGNQQKVALARGLVTNPEILLLDEPTRGVDVGARSEIHRIIEGMVENGTTVIVVSSDIIELIDISDRILVMRKGEIVAELTGDSATKKEVLYHATDSK
jgi:ribose transport system ATP-binding protein